MDPEFGMDKDLRNEDLNLTPEQKEKFGELVALLAKHGFGDNGPPLETAFARIQRFGHRAARMMARAGRWLLAGYLFDPPAIAGVIDHDAAARRSPTFPHNSQNRRNNHGG